MRVILRAVGENPARPGLERTPERVAQMIGELFAGVRVNPDEELAVIEEDGPQDLVVIRDIPLYSMCEHHLIPFVGRAHVAYWPDGGRITGLSKVVRMVDAYARRPQLQERLTRQIADAIETRLRPRGVAVVLAAEHLCMVMRGVQARGSRVVTTAVRGIFATDPAEREHVLAQIRP